MAREAGFTEGEIAFMGDNFRRFAELVRADERAACAKVVEALDGCAQYFPHVPDIIRNRGNT